MSQRSKLDNYLLDYIMGRFPSTFYCAPEAMQTATTDTGQAALPFQAVPSADIYAFGTAYMADVHHDEIN